MPYGRVGVYGKVCRVVSRWPGGVGALWEGRGVGDLWEGM